MKKTIVALAVLGSFAGVAAAQSSVTLFGVIDVAARYTKANGQSLKSLTSDGLSSSRLGVRGVEDLGGGLKAGFWLEGKLAADSGTVDTTRFWGRRSTISLMGDFGEVRLGRFKTSAQLQIEDFDPTSTVGLGSSENVYSKLGGAEYSRYDNMVTYVAPANLGGFYGSVDAAAGEGAALGKMFGGRVGYKQDALNVSGSYFQAGSATKTKFTTLGASYNFGVATPSLIYTNNEFGAFKQQLITLAVTAPVGTGSVWASYTDAKDKSQVASTVYKANQLAAGYIYNMSKRTALYTTVSKIDNGTNAVFSLNSAPVALKGNNSTGFDVGVKHSF